MTSNDVVFTAIGVLIVAALCGFALLPLLRGSGASAAATSVPVDEGPEAERYRLYKQVLEMEFDWHTGKLAREDYESLSAPLLARAGELLTTSQAQAADVDAEIEREIQAARRTFGSLLAPELLAKESPAG